MRRFFQQARARKTRKLSTANKVLVGFAAMSTAVASAALGLSNSADLARFETSDFYAVQQAVSKEILASGRQAVQVFSTASAQETMPKSLVLQALEGQSSRLPQDLQSVVVELRNILLAQAETGDSEQQENTDGSEQQQLQSLDGQKIALDTPNLYPNLGAGTTSSGSGVISGFTTSLVSTSQSGGCVSCP